MCRRGVVRSSVCACHQHRRRCRRRRRRRRRGWWWLSVRGRGEGHKHRDWEDGKRTGTGRRERDEKPGQTPAKYKVVVTGVTAPSRVSYTRVGALCPIGSLPCLACVPPSPRSSIANASVGQLASAKTVTAHIHLLNRSSKASLPPYVNDYTSHRSDLSHSGLL